MPNKDLLIQYLTLKTQAKKIDEEIELIKIQVQAEVESLLDGSEAEQVTLQEFPDISLSLAKARAKWQYSPTVQDLESDLKEMKKTEEQTGKAINLNDGKKDLRVNFPKEG